MLTINLRISINEKIQRGVALADFNQNNLDDIVFWTDDGNINLIYDSGDIAFDVTLGDDIRCAPVVANMNGENIIITGSRDDHLYAIHDNGDIKFSYNTGDKIDNILNAFIDILPILRKFFRFHFHQFFLLHYLLIFFHCI